jgi:ectoine hydroxylase-related dioxygenase (phytanoyl-CoA dioxygenase family)
MPRAISTFDADAPIDAILASLDTDGAVGVRGVIDAGLIKRIEADLAPHIERDRQRLAEQDRLTRQSVRVGAVLAKSRHVVPVLQSALIHAVCDRFLLPHCACYQLSSIHLVEVSPGSPAGALHRDDVIWPLRGERPLAVINFLVPLTEFTPESGCTCVIPGSHRWPRDDGKVGPGRLDLDVCEEVDRAELAASTLPRGSVLAVLGGAVHCSGANITAEPRRALSISVTLGWLRQEENLYLSVPRKVFVGLPEDVQRFIGYRIHDPYLGHTGFD